MGGGRGGEEGGREGRGGWRKGGVEVIRAREGLDFQPYGGKC